jgi:hypothetical protein
MAELAEIPQGSGGLTISIALEKPRRTRGLSIQQMSHGGASNDRTLLQDHLVDSSFDFKQGRGRRAVVIESNP